MIYLLSILRRDRGGSGSYRQEFSYEARSDSDTVATALTAINDREPLTDASGAAARPIEWECSCLQKKCGACAMVVNGRPCLACDARLADQRAAIISVEPLRKFPVVCDLVVDRSILFENLKTMRLWLREDAALADGDEELAYQASECIQCGCCLEVCPNFYGGGDFFGMAAVPVAARLLAEADRSAARELAAAYVRHGFEGCGKSMACRDVCPKKIDTEQLMVNANVLALWKRKRRKSL